MGTQKELCRHIEEESLSLESMLKYSHVSGDKKEMRSEEMGGSLIGLEYRLAPHIYHIGSDLHPLW